MRSRVNIGVVCLLGAALVLTAGCTAPIGARLTTPKAAFQQLHENALTAGEPSPNTRAILRRYNQELVFEESPDDTLKLIHSKAVVSRDRSEIFALAELNFLEAERIRHTVKPWEARDARDYYLASAVYSYLFLFGDAEQPKPDGFDTRFNIALHLYATALGQSLTEDKRGSDAVIVLKGGTRALPQGKLPVELVTNSLPLPMNTFSQFLLADPFEIHGLSVRNRRGGVGAPLIAVSEAQTAAKLKVTTPMTAFLRLNGGLKELDAGKCQASLELYSGYNATTVDIAGTSVPVAADLTAPMAYSMNQSLVWGLGRMQFLSANELVPTGVYLMQPFEEGKIPVVFVHGTFSSPVYWMEMANTLRSDDRLTRRFQFWYFIYNSGNPIVYSAKRLRDSLEAKIKEVDPNSKDPALQQMVVIGHSQGGLLTKLTATDTGDTLLNVAVSNRVEKLTAEDRAAVDPWLVYKHLPFVTRVVFVCTPHRGSYQVGGLVLELARRLISLPSRFTEVAQDVGQRAARITTGRELTPEEKAEAALPNSIYGMSSKNKFLIPLANIPLAPGVTGHTIAAVKGGEANKAEGGDGVVKYSSAHVDYVESELIVDSGHSVQGTPLAIEEVRRILYEHLSKLPAGAVPANPPTK